MGKRSINYSIKWKASECRFAHELVTPIKTGWLPEQACFVLNWNWEAFDHKSTNMLTCGCAGKMKLRFGISFHFLLPVTPIPTTTFSPVN